MKSSKSYWKRRALLELKYGDAEGLAEVFAVHAFSKKELVAIIDKIDYVCETLAAILDYAQTREIELNLDLLLLRAVDNIAPDKAKMLLGRGAKPTAQMVEIAASNSCLVWNGYNDYDYDDSARGVFDIAGYEGDFEILIALLDAGGDPGWIDKDDWKNLTCSLKKRDPIHKADGPTVAAWMRAQILAREMEKS